MTLAEYLKQVRERHEDADDDHKELAMVHIPKLLEIIDYLIPATMWNNSKIEVELLFEQLDAIAARDEK